MRAYTPPCAKSKEPSAYPAYRADKKKGLPRRIALYFMLLNVLRSGPVAFPAIGLRTVESAPRDAPPFYGAR
jgi:hypothetical protein